MQNFRTFLDESGQALVRGVATDETIHTRITVPRKMAGPGCPDVAGAMHNVGTGRIVEQRLLAIALSDEPFDGFGAGELRGNGIADLVRLNPPIGCGLCPIRDETAHRV